MASTKWLVELGGNAEILTVLPSVLRGPEVAVTSAKNGRLLLASPSLDRCTDPDEVRKRVLRLLPRLAAFLNIYAGANNCDFTVKNVFWVDVNGRVKQRMHAEINLTVISSQGLRELGA